MSETAKYRQELVPYCDGYGIDVGYGGDPIIDSAISVDMPQPYTHLGEHPLNLGGDARELKWFDDNVLDYVYSSHCLEDFEDTESLLREWLRVLRPKGRLVLLLPDQKRYEEYCRKVGAEPNPGHKIKKFGLLYIKQVLKKFPYVEILAEKDFLEEYNFYIVLQKKLPTHRSKLRKWIQKLGIERSEWYGKAS